jgi:hypothetical protein
MAACAGKRLFGLKVISADVETVAGAQVCWAAGAREY